MERIKQRKLRANGSLDSARVAKLADALDLGSSALIGVGVRLPPLAVGLRRQTAIGPHGIQVASGSATPPSRIQF